MNNVSKYAKYIAAHTASVGGVIGGIAFLVMGNIPAAVTSFIGAAAGFGVNISPGNQVTTAKPE